nr:MAG TPA: hypothetical protein [Caudoviricetes sp.]DAY79124.1 MAG TPA: hypothetical protein [Caudoviricetes sp.]
MFSKYRVNRPSYFFSSCSIQNSFKLIFFVFIIFLINEIIYKSLNVFFRFIIVICFFYTSSPPGYLVSFL